MIKSSRIGACVMLLGLMMDGAVVVYCCVSVFFSSIFFSRFSFFSIFIPYLSSLGDSSCVAALFVCLFVCLFVLYFVFCSLKNVIIIFHYIILQQMNANNNKKVVHVEYCTS